eukprot:GHVR01025095.1.p1 GENE.GHVR01025095.1~~GHVR01025095.1.p1  ORF type:complete len:142 (-),score=47.22 GHVR01025095.1:83-481(-)
MAHVDRTAEFFSIVDRLQVSTGPQGPCKAAVIGKPESAFNALSGEVAKEIQLSHNNIAELLKLVKLSGTAQDRTREIDELSYSIKTSVDSFNTKIDYLQKASEQLIASGSRHTHTHTHTLTQYGWSSKVTIS